MKPYSHRFSLFVAGSVLSILSSFAKAGVVPEGYPIGRYSSLWEHSPFTIASVQTDTVQANFASKLALVGLAKIGSDNLVTLLNKDSQERISVSSEANEQGIKLVSVDADSDPLKTTVTIQQGNETAKVKFDPALLAAPSAPVPGSPGVTHPPNVPHPQTTGAPPPVPVRVRRSLPIPSPYVPNRVPPVPQHR